MTTAQHFWVRTWRTALLCFGLMTVVGCQTTDDPPSSNNVLPVVSAIDRQITGDVGSEVFLLDEVDTDTVFTVNRAENQRFVYVAPSHGTSIILPVTITSGYELSNWETADLNVVTNAQGDELTLQRIEPEYRDAHVQLTFCPVGTGPDNEACEYFNVHVIDTFEPMTPTVEITRDLPRSVSDTNFLFDVKFSTNDPNASYSPVAGYETATLTEDPEERCELTPDPDDGIHRLAIKVPSFYTGPSITCGVEICTKPKSLCQQFHYVISRADDAFDAWLREETQDDLVSYTEGNEAWASVGTDEVVLTIEGEQEVVHTALTSTVVTGQPANRIERGGLTILGGVDTDTITIQIPEIFRHNAQKIEFDVVAQTLEDPEDPESERIASQPFTITFYYNDEMVIRSDVPYKFQMEPGGTSSVNIMPNGTMGSTPSTFGEIDPESLALINQDGESTTDDVETPYGTCEYLENIGVRFRANDVPGEAYCTLQLCENNHTYTCKQQEFLFRVIRQANPNPDTYNIVAGESYHLVLTDEETNTGLLDNDIEPDKITGRFLTDDDSHEITFPYTTDAGGELIEHPSGDGWLYTAPEDFEGDDVFYYQACYDFVEVTASVCVPVSITFHVRLEATDNPPEEDDNPHIDPPDTSDNPDQPTLTGRGKPNSTITIIIDGREIDTVNVDEDGNWSWTPKDPIEPGQYTITVRGADGTTTDITISIRHAYNDDEGQTLIERPHDGAITAQRTPTIVGTSLSNQHVALYIDYMHITDVAADDTGQWFWRVSPALSLGEHRLSAYGANGASSTVIITIEDPSAYTGDVRIDSPEDDAIIEGTTLTVNGKTQANGTVLVYLNDVITATAKADEQGAWTWTSQADLEEGEHHLIVVADNGSMDEIHVTTYIERTSTSGCDAVHRSDHNGVLLLSILALLLWTRRKNARMLARL